MVPAAFSGGPSLGGERVRRVERSALKQHGLPGSGTWSYGQKKKGLHSQAVVGCDAILRRNR